MSLRDALTRGRTTQTNSTLQVDGLSELADKLELLDATVADKLLRSALMAGAKVIAQAAKDAAPIAPKAYTKYARIGKKKRAKGFKAISRKVQPGTLRNSIRAHRVKALDTTNDAAVAVRPVKGRKGDPYYWYFQEYGTLRHRAQPFLHRSFDANNAKALDIFAARLTKNVDRAIKKQAAQGE